MKKVKFYRENAFEFHKNVLAAKRNTNKKQAVLELIETIKNQFEKYESCFSNDNLHVLQPISVSEVQKSALIDMYSFQMEPFQKLFIYLTTDERDRVSKLCPNCTINNSNSLDHYIPKSEFPEFSANPKNLIQCCMECNGKKSIIWRTDSTRKFLNLFIDELPDCQYLYIDSQITNGVPIISFRLEKPQGLDQNLYNMIYNHYTGLDLLNRFSVNSSDIIDELAYDIQSLKDAEVSDTIIKQAQLNKVKKLQDKMGYNYWKSILIKECISNDSIYTIIKGE